LTGTGRDARCVAMCSSRRRSAMSEFAHSSAPLPSRSVKRPSLDVLPDGVPQDYCSTDFGDRAFQEQVGDSLRAKALLSGRPLQPG
jgi:hypothetical protein